LRAKDYDSRCITEVDSRGFKISGEIYSVADMIAYLKKLGMQVSKSPFAGSVSEMRAASRREHLAVIVAPINILIGGVMGAAWGYFSHWTNEPDLGGVPGLSYNYYSRSSSSEIRQDALIGGGAGALAAVAWYYFFRNGRQQHMISGSKKYNKELFRRLRLDFSFSGAGMLTGMNYSF
jgi:hypothetical protein